MPRWGADGRAGGRRVWPARMAVAVGVACIGVGLLAPASLAGGAAGDLTARVAVDCDGGGASVTVRNDGSSDATTRVVMDAFPIRELDVPADGSATLLVPLLDDRASSLQVLSGDDELLERTVTSHCLDAGNVAVVVEHCPGGAEVLARAPAGGTLDVRVDGTIVERAPAGAEVEVRRSLELDGEGAQDVEVAVDGTVVAAGPVGGCDGDTAGAVTCGATGAPACATAAPAPTTTLPPPPPPPPPLVLDRTLAHTGPWERAVVLLGAGGLLVAGGLMSMGARRRRPEPSLLGEALAPYRQTWWRD